jgi:hypothetical protein
MKCHKCEHEINMHRITIENNPQNRIIFIRCFNNGLGCNCDMSFNRVVINKEDFNE